MAGIVVLGYGGLEGFRKLHPSDLLLGEQPTTTWSSQVDARPERKPLERSNNRWYIATHRSNAKVGFH
ncbi:hypothetical protein E5D57_000991 [Metarhizium anisopliae]|nr:hypothetical protein E5D57_000991 [Metarhizium anisopliae]